MEEDQKLNRRNFFKVAIAAIAAVIGGGFTIPGVAYILGPVLQKQEEQSWIRVGSLSKVELGVPTLFKAKLQRQTGWIVNEEEISVYVLTEDGREFVAMSNICTHLGCRVRWIRDEGEFFCPCHNAVFDREGQVVAGPPPRPLDRFEVKLEDDQIFILGG